MTMRRDEALKLLAPHVKDSDIVVAVFTSAFEWIAIRPNPLNYIMTGAMGLGSSHALGLALGRPDKRVIVLDGDGSLLMNLGSLVTIGNAAPENFIHFVLENGTYEANGSHLIPGKDKVDFSAIAKAAGYRGVHTFSGLNELGANAESVLNETGPVFVTMKIEPGPQPNLDYGYMHSARVRQEFRTAVRADLPK
ncbi:MAG: thiamine pyrophosphate-binding protein [Bradyrhizobium sp.]|uniref:thiamine pyrophosphate-dependent enzyme n=1 Tax=Bradyrhizobium sp. TaxID=376 RepID=UPI001DDDAAD4|nr:thiamine pyrophosphate-dependent enzyme [Bradyrhizobium sp.]MBV9560310.1 thiamine pyrophosphate-binding protein [Bradyrhizobium sp.]